MMTKKLKSISPQSIAKNAALTLASCLVVLVLGEVAVRLIPRVPPRVMEIDRELGWKTPANLDYEYAIADLAGETHRVVLRTDENGFRHFGDLDAARPKVLIIGDSYTLATDVSQDETYAALLGTALDVEIFALGTAGYGTLQELMVFDEWVDVIDPDIVLWQFCGNDFYNNAYDLERVSVLNNNGLRRPYHSVDGELFYATPHWFPAFRRITARYSRLLYGATTRFDLLRMRLRGETVGDRIVGDSAAVPEYQDAVRITSDLFGDIRERAGTRPVVAFTTTEYDPFLGDFAAACDSNGIVPALGVGAAVWGAHESGESVLAKDGGHWNPNGHRICAEVLIEFLATSETLGDARLKRTAE